MTDNMETTETNNAMLAALSPEEREALEYDLTPEEGGPVDLADDDGDEYDDTPEAEGETDEGDEPEQEPETAEDAQPAETEAAADEPEAAPAPAANKAPDVAYSYQLPADYQERVKALADKFTSLDERSELGELSAAEYARELRQLTREQTELDSIQMRHDLAQDMAQQAQQAAAARDAAEWDSAVRSLVAEIKADASQTDKVDYVSSQDAGMALGQQVQAIVAARGLIGQPIANKLELLRDAHRAIRFLKTGQVLGAQTAPTPAPAASAEDRKAVSKKRTADLSKAVPAIATMPGADTGVQQGGEFAALDNMDGPKLEAALARLKRTDPEAYARYLAGG